MAKILVINPDGKKGYVPEENLDAALQAGYQLHIPNAATVAAGGLAGEGQALLETIPGYKQAMAGIGAVGEKVGELFGAEEKPVSERFNDILAAQQRLKEESVTRGAIGATTGAISVGGAAGVGLKAAGLVSGQVGAKSFLDRLSTGESIEDASVGALSDASVTLGIDLATLGAGKLISAAAKSGDKAAVNIIQKISGLTKRAKEGKISPTKARESAEELLKKSPFMPTIKRLDKSVQNRLSETEMELADIYRQTDKLVKGKNIIDKNKYVNTLLDKAEVAEKGLDTTLADQLRRYAKRIDEIEGSHVPVMKAWERVKKLGNEAYKEGAQLSDEAAAEARSALKTQLDGTVELVDSTGELITRLRQLNKETHNLLNAVKPLSKEASKKSAGLLPSTGDILITGLSAYADTRLAAIYGAYRTGKVLGPGIAIQGLRGLSGKGEVLQQAAGPFASLAGRGLIPQE